MRVLVLCKRPETALADSQSAACIVRDLGCDLHLARFDLRDLAGAALEPGFSMVLVDAEDEIPLAKLALQKLRDNPVLAPVPSLAILSLQRLASLDFTRGFNDFCLSPLVPAELYARMRQLDWRAASFASDDIMKVDGLVLDLAGYQAHLDGRPLDFTHQEFELLQYLVKHRGRVFSRETLLEEVWDYDGDLATRTVDVHIRRLRAKLGASAAKRIVTVRNVGYKMD